MMLSGSVLFFCNLVVDFSVCRHLSTDVLVVDLVFRMDQHNQSHLVDIDSSDFLHNLHVVQS